MLRLETRCSGCRLPVVDASIAQTDAGPGGRGRVDGLVHHAGVIVLRGDSYPVEGQRQGVLQAEGGS